MSYAEDLFLQEELEPLRKYIGTTWKGIMQESDPDNVSIDIQHWERILNGTALRITHSINDGIYGGETIIFWNKELESLAYYYFTTAGFFTKGTMLIEGKAYIATESVTGNEQGITEVISISEILDDGSMRVTSEFFKNGEWVDGHIINYNEAPDEKVIFK